MLVFVVPLQSKAIAKSWQRVSQLLERCVRSACQQRSSKFRVIVVCHEKPDIAFEHPHLSYVKAEFKRPDVTTGSYIDILNRKRTDKGRKQLKGLVAAGAFNPTHTMLLDADDLVSNRLAEFVEQNSAANGWYFQKGYRYTPGDRWIYRKFRDFHTMCGSCNILRYDLNDLPEEAEYNRGYGYYKLYIDHGNLKQELGEQGTPLEALPFPGGVYVVQTGENIYFDPSRLNKNIAKYLNYRWVTPALKAEFNL